MLRLIFLVLAPIIILKRILRKSEDLNARRFADILALLFARSLGKKSIS